ncbi:ABC transporter ATP-binding protein [Beijerinckia sp. L45]|uniref:ABC transporter ATP-binding protein n=1 Tax=Beijerinckia sp. L45 TaxID=1641855 RepID=UPI00131DB200|nr:ABC transporter ATP-binding protein [Beijerinckia sp. L45]
MAGISLVGIGKTFAQRSKGRDTVIKVLDDLTFDVADGEIVALCGPSGCGKTTALRIAMGLEAPTKGHITVDQRRVKGCGHDRGIIFQHAELLPWLTAKANVMFGLEMKGIRGSAASDVAMSYLDLVGLSASAERRPHQLSGGMRQRVGIARALAIDPGVLLMDEPFGALDAQSREGLQTELLAIHAKTRKTIVIVTHDLDEAVILADRILVLGEGRLQEVIDVRLPRQNRDSGTLRAAPEFTDARFRLWQALHRNTSPIMVSGNSTDGIV